MRFTPSMSKASMRRIFGCAFLASVVAAFSFSLLHAAPKKTSKNWNLSKNTRKQEVKGGQLSF
jgi:hypothetical protein